MNVCGGKVSISGAVGIDQLGPEGFDVAQDRRDAVGTCLARARRRRGPRRGVLVTQTSNIGY